MKRLMTFLILLLATPCWAEVTPLGRIIPMTGPPAGAAGGLPRVFGPTAQVASPGVACRQAIRATERLAGIPEHLMAAIARVESGRTDPQGGINPWPWTINVEGAGQSFATKAEAIAAVTAAQARGARSIDVGCMQVNLMYHPTAFATLDQAFDPATNVRYAAQFLQRLRDQSGSWQKATALYHSATPDLGATYERKVATVLPEEKARQSAIPAQSGGNVWSQNAWTANAWNTGPAPGGGGQMLGNRADLARIIPVTSGTAVRGLDAYRAAPIPLTARAATMQSSPALPMAAAGATVMPKMPRG